MKKLIVSADDFGLVKEVNDGVITAIREGIVTSVNVMVTRPGFNDAMMYLKAHPEISIALHLDLKEFFNIEKGTGKIFSYKDETIPLYEILAEIEKQVKTFRDSGMKSAHFDSHYYLHHLPELFPHILEKMNKLGFRSFSFNRGFYETEYPSVNFDWLEKYIVRYGFRIPALYMDGWSFGILDSIPEGVSELHTHPALIQGGMDSFDWRVAELTLCCDPDTKKYIKQNKIKLATFNDLYA